MYSTEARQGLIWLPNSAGIYGDYDVKSNALGRRRPCDDALALLLTFGSATTRCEDFHLTSSVLCPAHARTFSRALLLARFACFVAMSHVKV